MVVEDVVDVHATGLQVESVELIRHLRAVLPDAVQVCHLVVVSSLAVEEVESHFRSVKTQVDGCLLPLRVFVSQESTHVEGVA